MRYLSLFSGIEAASVAWGPLGWTPVAFAEIEPFPCSLLEHRFPGVPNLGDVTTITDAQIAALGPIDLVVGGSPCQDLSVAGKRAGLKGARSSLFHEQVRIFHAARTLCGARFLVWENVPGVFSTHGGRDFAVVVGTLAGCELAVPVDGWGYEGVALGPHGLVEWGVLDAQFFGVAQRRRRVFAVLDAGNWHDRPPVLLEPESLRGNPPTRRKAGEGTPARALRSSDGGIDREDGHSLIVGTLGAEHGNVRAEAAWTGRLIPEVAWALQERDAKGGDSDTNDGHLIPVALFDERNVTSPENRAACDPREAVPTMHASGPMTIAFDPQGGGKQTTLGASGTGALGTKKVPGVASAMQVRRLTPRECERLQGFPDDWTAVPHRGRPAADGPRYRALGNSMAVPCMAWIGRQISACAMTRGGPAERNGGG